MGIESIAWWKWEKSAEQVSDEVRWKSHVIVWKSGKPVWDDSKKKNVRLVTLVVERPNYYAQTTVIRFVLSASSRIYPETLLADRFLVTFGFTSKTHIRHWPHLFRFAGRWMIHSPIRLSIFSSLPCSIVVLCHLNLFSEKHCCHLILVSLSSYFIEFETSSPENI